MTIAITLHPRRRGFTLAELLVAMAITILLLTLLVSVTGVALDGWRTSRNRVRAARQAKAALEQVSRDFESMVVRAGNSSEWFFAESESSAPGPSSNKSPNAARLIFFTAATDRYDGDIGGARDKGGDVSAVSYRLFYRDPITDGNVDEYNVFSLYRKLVNPDEAFEDLLAEDDLDGAFSSYDSEVDESANFICENIFEMSIIFHIEYSEAGNGGSIVTKQAVVPIVATSGSDAVEKFRILGTGFEADGDDDKDYSHGRIVSIDISVTVLTDGGAAALRNANFPAAALEKFLSKNTYRFSKTVIVPQP